MMRRCGTTGTRHHCAPCAGRLSCDNRCRRWRCRGTASDPCGSPGTRPRDACRTMESGFWRDRNPAKVSMRVADGSLCNHCPECLHARPWICGRPRTRLARRGTRSTDDDSPSIRSAHVDPTAENGSCCDRTSPLSMNFRYGSWRRPFPSTPCAHHPCDGRRCILFPA